MGEKMNMQTISTIWHWCFVVLIFEISTLFVLAGFAYQAHEEYQTLVLPASGYLKMFGLLGYVIGSGIALGVTASYAGDEFEAFK
jgi:hypothetical protein